MEDPLLGSVLGERYRLEECLDKGGMGAVYRATDQRSGELVAVKLIHPALAMDRGIRERFRREAMAASALEHPNIARALDFGEDASGRSWLVMELVRGKKLSDVMAEGVLSEGRALFIASQVLDALAATHAAGIVHRDLKPPNVVLVRIGGVEDVVKLMDFGIAKLMESEAYQRLTRTGEIIGTPSFMAPEQARGDAVDGRSDIYALGVLLYGMLANRLPYDFYDPAQLIVAIQDQPPVPLTTTAPSVNPRVWTDVLVRALAKRPQDRFATAEEMKAAIEPLLDARTTGNLRRVSMRELRVSSVPPAPAPRLASLPPAAPAVSGERVKRSPSHPRPRRAAGRTGQGKKAKRRLGLVLTLAVIGIVLAGATAFVTLEMLFGRSRAASEEANGAILGSVSPATPVSPVEVPTVVPPSAPMVPTTPDGPTPAEGEGAGPEPGGEVGDGPEPNGEGSRCERRARVTRVEADMIDPVLVEGALAGRARAVARCMRGPGERQLEGYLHVNAAGRATFLEWKSSTGIRGPAEEACIERAIAPLSLPSLPTHEGAVRFFLSGRGCD